MFKHFDASKFLIALKALIFSLVALSPSGYCQILLSESFEGTALPFAVSGKDPIISNEQANTGTKSLKLDLDYGDSPINYRQELTGLLVEGSKNFTVGSVYWIGVSAFIPSNWNSNTTLSDIVFQMHADPDSGEADRNPPLALHVDGGNWKATYLGDNRGAYDGTDYQASGNLDLGPLEKGKWVRFVFQFKVDWGSTGFLKAYRDGMLVDSYSGPIFFNDQKGPYLKMGLYRPAWRSDNASWGDPATHDNIFHRTFYLDDVRIGSSSTTLADMMTNSGSGSSTLPSQGSGKVFFTGAFESGKVNTAGQTTDGFYIQTHKGNTYTGIGSGGAGADSGLDTRVMKTEVVGSGTVTPRAGNYFLRSEIFYDKDYTTFTGNGGQNKPRSTIAMSNSSLRFDYDTEGYLGFSIFTPTNYKHETGITDDRGSVMLLSTYATTQSTFFSLSQFVSGSSNEAHWWLNYYTDDSSVQESTQAQKLVDLGPVTPDIGKWTDFVIRYRANPFSTSTNPATKGIAGASNKTFEGNKGILQVWKATGNVDGSGNRSMSKVLDIVDQPVGLVPSATDQLMHSFRIYKYGWHKNPTSITDPIWFGFDEIRQGLVQRDGTTYADVLPKSTGYVNPPTIPITNPVGSFNADFEVNSIMDYNWLTSGNDPSISSEQACNGKKSMKVYVNRDNPADSATSYRTEITRISDAWPNTEGATVELFKQEMISFAFYVPVTNSLDPGEDRGDIILQFHPGQEIDGDGNVVPNVTRNPVLAIMVDNDRYTMSVKGDDAVLTDKSNLDVAQNIDAGPVTKGKWVNIQLQYRMDYRVNGTGMAKLWIDGIEKASYSGQLSFNDPKGPYVKFGIYKPVWKSSRANDTPVNERLFYFDDFNVFGEGATQLGTAIKCGTTVISKPSQDKSKLIFLGDYEVDQITVPGTAGSGLPIENTFWYSGMGPNCEPRGNDPRPDNGSRLVTGNVLTGQKAMRQEVRYDCDYRPFNEGDPRPQKPRTETKANHPNAQLQVGKVYWVAFGFYLEPDFIYDYPKNPDNLFQMVKEESGTTGELGKDLMAVGLHGGNARVTFQHPGGLSTATPDTKEWPATRGMWHKVVFNFRLCKTTTPNCSGFIKMYLNDNDTPFYEDNGPNTISDTHHTTVNLYKYGWHCTGDTRYDYNACMQNPNPTHHTTANGPRFVTFDDFNIGGSDATIYDVMPSWGGGSSPVQEPPGTCPNGKTCKYVSYSVGDDTGSGSKSDPWKTVNYALSKVEPGNYLFLKAGDTWPVPSVLTIEKANLTIAGYDIGARPVLSGSNFSKPNAASPYLGLIEVGAANNEYAGDGLTLMGVEVKQSSGNGVRVWSRNVTIDGVFCNQAYAQCFQGRPNSKGLKIINSIAFNHNWGANESNANSVNRPTLQCYAGDCAGQGWGVGIMTRGTDSLIARNKVYAGYGESMGAGCGADKITFEDNTIVDGKVGIYVDASTNIIIRNNLIMGTASAPHQRGSTAGEGIGVNNEPYCRSQAVDIGRAGSTANISIYNNLVSGRSVGLFFYAETDSLYKGVKIYNNSLIDNAYGITFAAGQHESTLLANNIFAKVSSDPKVQGLIKGFNVSGDKAQVIWRNNYWSSRPELAADFAVDTDPGAVVGGDIQIPKKSGYFDIDSYDEGSWVQLSDMETLGGATDGKGINLSSFGISYDKDIYGNAVSAPLNIGPFFDEDQGLSIPPPTPPTTALAPPKTPTGFRIL